MHELRIAHEVITVAQEEMERRRLSRLDEIGVRLGALSGVNPDALSFGFEAATIDTPLAHTKLHIEQVPVTGICQSCTRGFKVEEFVFICPHCGSRDMNIIQGQELDIEYLVGE